MKKTTLILALFIAFFITACNQQQNTTSNMNNNNPLLQEFTNEYGIPPFDQIKNEHFLPAFKVTMEKQLTVIEQIVDNSDAPTFENTIEALEYSYLDLSSVSAIFHNFLSINTDDELQEIAQELATLSTQHHAEIVYNQDLFAKVKIVYNNLQNLNLSQEQTKLLEETYKMFVRAGVDLPEDQQNRLKEINEQLSKLTLTFDNNNLTEVNNFKLIIENEADLSGLPQSIIDEAAELAINEGMTGKWIFTIHKPVLIPFLQYCENRDLREQMFKAYTNLGDNDNDYDNKDIVNQIVNLRIEKAHILGYNTYAEYVLEENMSKTPEKVYEFLYNIFEKSLVIAQQEANDLQAMIDAEGGNFELQPWDWWYYTAKIKKSKYSLNEEEIREYFQLDTVIKGLFTVVKKLYNLDIEALPNVPVPHPDAIAFKITDATDGSHIGVLFMDFYPRASKQSGAWMDNYVNQYVFDGVDNRPVITNVLNFTKPNGNTPALLSLDEVSTLFHERDFVELPSQIMENWANDPVVIKTFAKHYQTGEVIPDDLLQKIENASKFNQGFATVEYLAASLLDMDYHSLSELQDIDANAFETASMQKINMLDEIVVRYRSTYFGHIFAGGYSAGYYGYIWAEVLDADAYQAFKQTGDVYNQDVAKAFRENILEKGGTDDPMKLYINFRGQEPSIEPLLQKRGLSL